MGDDDERLSESVAKVKEESMEFLFVFCVERARRFVCQDDGRVVDECPCHSDTLFLTAREFGRFVVGTVAEVKVFEQFLGSLAGLLLAGASNESWDADVFKCRKFRQELMELEYETEVLVAKTSHFLVFQLGGVDTIDTHRTCVGGVEGAHDLEEGGFTRSRWTDNADHLAFADVKVDAFEHLKGAERFGNVVELYHCCIMGLLEFTWLQWWEVVPPCA